MPTAHPSEDRLGAALKTRKRLPGLAGPIVDREGPDEHSLIVNADDFGRSHAVNAGVIKAHEDGIVRSASIMVRWPAALEAAEYGKSHPELSLGLHVDLGEWLYLANHWMPIYEVVPSHSKFHTVEDEALRQIEAFEQLVGKPPTHLDSHQHCHRREPLRSVLLNAARKRGIPLREHSPNIRYCGYFHGQCARGKALPERVSIAHLRNILSSLPSGITELSCHPALGEDATIRHCRERNSEMRTLCSAEIRETVRSNAIELISFFLTSAPKELSLPPPTLNQTESTAREDRGLASAGESKVSDAEQAA
ncbi:MAG: hypothetical protein QOE70_1284 [Chthoniobacter sp.]|jgi:predicted glycoside hydrolase/deacetylase ChbG (UPF0249 family)|nr:hypothetical protein [Chthoniobacter sp.]